MRSRASTTPSSEADLIVFARAPVAGKATTRLAAAIGADAAAQLHARLVERALATALAARTGRVELYCTPDVRHPFFARIASRLGVPLRSQGRGDLARMQRALARALRTAPAAVLITDFLWFPATATPAPAVRITREPTPERKPGVGELIVRDEMTSSATGMPPRPEALQPPSRTRD